MAACININTIEGYFSIFKRGKKGIYQHCGTKHLHRYMAEFDFHYSNRAALDVNDVMQAYKPLMGAIRKHLTYCQRRSKIGLRGGAKLGHFGFVRAFGMGGGQSAALSM